MTHSSSGSPGAHRSRAAGVRRSLRLSVIEGSLHAAMVGASESFLGALAVELGHGPLNLALLATLPPLAGALMQLAAPRLAALLGGRARVVFWGALLQAASHLAIVAVVLTDSRTLWPLLLSKTLYWTAGMAGAPMWGAWMADLTRGVDRSRYFAKRAVATNIALLVGFLVGGAVLVLDVVSLPARFSVILATGAVLRFAGAALFLRHVEPGTRPARTSAAETRWDWTTVSFGASMAFAVNVTAPFFTPYMLRELGLGYATFTALLASSIVAKMAASFALPQLAKRVGMRRLAAASALLIALIPALWVPMSSVWWILGVQLVGGIGWGAYEFALFQALITGSPVMSRLTYLSIAACLQSGGAVVGGVVGSSLLAAAIPYSQVFLVGTGVRLLPAVLWAATRRDGPMRFMASRIDSVRPGAGTVGRVIPIGEGPPAAGAVASSPTTAAHRTAGAEPSRG